MASRTASDQNRPQLEALLQTWESRWRTRRLVLYFPRALLIVLGIALLFTIALITLSSFAPLTTILLVSTGILLGAVGAAAGLHLYRISEIEAARHFDQVFELQERVSTALELIDGRIRTLPELSEAQIGDALEIAQNVDPQKVIKLETRWKEWAAVLSLLMALIAVLGAYWLLGYANEQDGNTFAAQTAINQAADDVRDITEMVALEGGLTDEERQVLLESLEVSLDELSSESISPEEAFVELDELESQLRDTAESIREELAAQDESLEAAADALQNLPDRPDVPEAGEETGASQELQEALERLQEQLDSLTPEQLEQIQQQLEEAAESTSQSIPSVSQELSELAEALNSPENPGASESLNQALEQLESLEGEQLERLETSEQLDSAGDQARRAAEEVSEAETDSSQTEQAAADPGEESEGSSEAPGGQSPSESDEQNQNTSDTGSPVLSEDSSGQPVEIRGEADTPPGDAENASDSSQSEAGGGSGEGEGRQQDAMGGPQDSQDSNDADGEGITEYEGIYVGENINVSGSVNIELEADASDSPTVEGDFQENPIGEAQVPYNQVFQSYQDAANRALENDYVPLGMRDVVRDYFSSLDPASRSDQ